MYPYAMVSNVQNATGEIVGFLPELVLGRMVQYQNLDIESARSSRGQRTLNVELLHTFISILSVLLHLS